MARPSLEEQIKWINRVFKKYPRLERTLSFYKDILEVRMNIRSYLYDIEAMHLCNAVIKSLEEKALMNKKPITYILDIRIPSLNNILNAVNSIINILNKHEFNKELENLSKILSEERNLYSIFITASFRNESKTFIELSSKLGINLKLLTFIFNTLIQSFLEELARKTSKEFLDNWLDIPCPICGREPFIAKIRDKKKYLVCPLCGSEYRTSSLLCVNCGNRDPYTLGFLIDKNNSALKIDVCMKCRHYVKVIDEDLLKEEIPGGLEDILTLELDKIAELKGFKKY